MKFIPLNHNKKALVDNRDYELVKDIKWRWAKWGNYGVTGGHGKTITIQQLIMGKPPKGKEIDHINGNGLDNRQGNLRFCTHQQNMMNRKGWAKSGHKGITVTKYGRFRVRIKKDGKTYHLGSYTDLEIAKEVYSNKAKYFFGEFAGI